MTEYINSCLALGGQLDYLSLAAFALAALFVFALFRQYWLRFAVPPAFEVRAWYPLPADLPTGPVPAYGAPELQRTYRSNLAAGVGGSAVIHLLVITTALFVAAIFRTTPPPPDPHITWKKPIKVDAPPSLREPGASIPLPPAYDSRLPPPPQSHIPIPVVDSRLNLETTIMGIDELGLQSDPGYTGLYDIFSPGPGPAGPGGGGGPGADESTESAVSLDLVERLPELVSIPTPVYPEMARVAEVEGIVLMDILVGADGRVHDVRIVKSVPMLDDAARAAALGAVFRPALWRNRPVAVRVTLPIRFRLADC